jgi:two-component system chemotaxis sensor kinase CheA
MPTEREAASVNQPNDNGARPDRRQSVAALKALRKAVKAGLEPNDLGRLAQMHTACQTLATLGGAAGELAAAVADLLERIILKEAADTDGGLALIPQAVKLLGNVLDGHDADVAPLLAQVCAAATGEPSSASGLTTNAVASVAPPEPAVPAASPPPAAQIEEYVAEPLVIDLAEREHLEAFIAESREHMDAIEVALLEVEQAPGDTAKINELFRPFHTIKGIAGFLNLRDINRLTHELETILDLARKNELTITADTIDLFFSAIDVLKQQIGALAKHLASPSGNAVPQPNIVEIMARLQATAAGQAPPRAATRTPDTAPPVTAAACTPSAPAGAAPVSSSGSTGGSSQIAETSIRVDTAKLDFLVDAIGELVIAQTMVNTNAVVATDKKLIRDVSQVSKIVRDVQETAMAMRMIPIGHTFQKMRRLVRDVARKAGKQVELRISGQETELDKNVIQAIADPLVHMVRNAVDHGIETPERRRAAGKPDTGTLHLNAFHRGDSIVVEIRDDGKGLDRDKLIAKGIERGLLTPGDQLSDQQVFNLILQPGFSTAEQVTEISGRGVGMDVVHRNIEKLRGKIDIASEPGRGSVFSIRLPLTLAIIDGMLVRVGNERLIIPTIMIEQTLRPERRQITLVQRKGALIQARGELITLIQLGPLFGFSDPIDPAEASVVIAHTETDKIGIVVDELIGQQQVVIKTLGERFKPAKGVSGAAILGDGRVGLILEPTGLLALHNSCEVAAHVGHAVNDQEPQEQQGADESSAAGPTKPEAVLL